jgi:F0F1-type ATP synthase assembly protein I
MGDPWQAFGYVTAGVLVYGFLGWLLDRWWGTSFVVVIGILAGAGLGIYMTFGRFGRPPETPATPDSTTGTSETGRTEE